MLARVQFYLRIFFVLGFVSESFQLGCAYGGTTRQNADLSFCCWYNHLTCCNSPSFDSTLQLLKETAVSYLRTLGKTDCYYSLLDYECFVCSDKTKKFLEVRTENHRQLTTIKLCPTFCDLLFERCGEEAEQDNALDFCTNLSQGDLETVVADIDNENCFSGVGIDQIQDSECLPLDNDTETIYAEYEYAGEEVIEEEVSITPTPTPTLTTTTPIHTATIAATTTIAEKVATSKSKSKSKTTSITTSPAHDSYAANEYYGEGEYGNYGEAEYAEYSNYEYVAGEAEYAAEGEIEYAEYEYGEESVPIGKHSKHNKTGGKPTTDETTEDEDAASFASIGIVIIVVGVIFIIGGAIAFVIIRRKKAEAVSDYSRFTGEIN